MNLVKNHTLFTKGAVYYNNITILSCIYIYIYIYKIYVYLNEEIGLFF